MINGSYSYGLFNVTNIETIVRPECAQHTTCTLQLAREIVNYGEINGMAITKTVATSLVNQSGNKKSSSLSRQRISFNRWSGCLCT